MVVAVLALIGIFIATYLTLYKVGVIGTLVCSIGSCERVQTSRWAMFLRYPVALWGVGYYVVLFVLALVGIQPRFIDRRGISVALVALTAWGVLFSAWLTYLELFRIHAICIWCVGSAVLVALLFITSALDLRDTSAGAEA